MRRLLPILLLLAACAPWLGGQVHDVVPHCDAACPDGRADGGCPPSCADCGCCPHVIPAAALPPAAVPTPGGAGASPAAAEPARPAAPPREVLHVPRASLD